jgi:hypothetical protein
MKQSYFVISRIWQKFLEISKISWILHLTKISEISPFFVGKLTKEILFAGTLMGYLLLLLIHNCLINMQKKKQNIKEWKERNLYEKAPLMIFVAASSRSASSSTMHESLPPSSICSGIIPAFFDMEIPVSQPPVKLHQTSHIWYLDAFFLIGIVLPKKRNWNWKFWK